MTALQIALVSVGGALVFAALILFVGGYITYRMAFFNDPIKKPVDPYRYSSKESPTSELSRSLIDRLLSEEYEDIFVTSHDGLRLHARLYQRGEGAPVAICAHGYKSLYAIDFSGGAPDLMDKGFTVILIDERASGISEGNTVSFGYNEKRDVLRWINFVGERFGAECPIILFGVSMGAATVLMAAAEGLPPSVKGVLADCPYSSSEEIIRKVIGDMRLPSAVFYPLVRFGARVYGGFDPSRAELLSSAREIRIPTVIIHGEGDSFVPIGMSTKAARLNPEYIRHEAFPEAGHGQSYLYDRERYRRIVDGHISTCIGENYNK